MATAVRETKYGLLVGVAALATIVLAEIVSPELAMLTYAAVSVLTALVMAAAAYVRGWPWGPSLKVS